MTTAKAKEEVETNGHPQIYGLMAKVLNEVESIEKSRKNEQQNYRFRGIDEVYAAIHPMFAKHGIFTVPRVLGSESFERETKTGGILRFVEMKVAYDFFAPDGSCVTAEAVGEAMDSGDKASNKAMSAAHKYVILQTFCIPTGDTPDADATTHDDLKPAIRCPECGKTTAVIKGKEEYGGGWLCFGKKGGCGAKWQDVQDGAPTDGKTGAEKPTAPAKKPTGNEEAEIKQLHVAIKHSGKLLRELGDADKAGNLIDWKLEDYTQFANDNFNVKGGVNDLTLPQLREMLALLSARIDRLKKPATPLSDLMKSVLSNFDSEKHFATYLAEHDYPTADKLTEAHLLAIEKDVEVPF